MLASSYDLNRPSPKGFLPANAISPSSLRLELIRQEAKGEKKPLSVLFVHGIYQGAWVFKDGLMPFFAKNGYDSYAFSWRGHGGSEGREALQKTSFDNYLSDLRQVLKQIDGPVLLVGHSAGGMLVQRHLESASAAGAILMCTPEGDDMKKTQFGTLLKFPWSVLTCYLRATLTISTTVVTSVAKSCLAVIGLPQPSRLWTK